MDSHHVSNFNKASVIGKSKKQLESCRTHAWHTMTTTNTITNSCSLSAQWSTLFHWAEILKFISIKICFIFFYHTLLVLLFIDLVKLNMCTFPWKISLHTINDIIFNFVNRTVAPLPSRTLLKGTVTLRIKLKATVVDSNCWHHESIWRQWGG